MSAVFDRRTIDWLLTVQVVPRTRRDPRELERLIPALSAEHDGFLAMLAEDSGVILVGACDERALEQNVILLRDKMSGDFEVGAPEVGYRETIRRAAEVDHCHDARSGDLARLKLAVEPRGFGPERSFEIRVEPSALPKACRLAIERAIESELDRGPVSGYPVIGLLVSVLEVASEAAAPSEMALETAARAALGGALREAGPVLLEPIMKLEVVTPADHAGDLIADFTSRRGRITSADTRDDRSTIEVEVPLGNLFGYHNSLAAMAQGRATYSATFSRYARVPAPADDEPPWPEPASGALRG